MKDQNIRCARPGCNWRGKHSELTDGNTRISNGLHVTQKVCPKCGCKSYYKARKAGKGGAE